MFQVQQSMFERKRSKSSVVLTAGFVFSMRLFSGAVHWSPGLKRKMRKSYHVGSLNL